MIMTSMGLLSSYLFSVLRKLAISLSLSLTHTQTLPMLKLKVVLSRKTDWLMVKAWGEEKAGRKRVSPLHLHDSLSLYRDNKSLEEASNISSLKFSVVNPPAQPS